MRILYVSILVCLLSCSFKHRKVYAMYTGYRYFSVQDTFDITVQRFVKNDAYCFTEGIPYALIIGKTNGSNLPKTVSVLAQCDNNTYAVGQVLRILPIEDPTLSTTLKPFYLVRDSLVNRRVYLYLIGDEYPAIWGQVIK